MPLEEYSLSSKRIHCLCTICGYEWSPTPNYLLMGGGCIKCNRIYQTSFPEQAIYYYVRRFYTDAINGYREIFDNNELDVYIPSIKVGIEYDGTAASNWKRLSAELKNTMG